MTASTASPVHLVTVESTTCGPYAALAPAGFGPYDRLLFTREGAQQIVDDLHRHAGGVTTTWEGESLHLSWEPGSDRPRGSELVKPDARGRYAVGGLWPWTSWEDQSARSARQAAFARGVRESFTAASASLPGELAPHYGRGRSQAYRLTLLPLVSSAPAGCGQW
ncbi:hypothetical protein OG440_38440 (plasmid) [Streptomyces sp. NBC_00637]|uniref:hypothetical protein n=1 Tax=Streptomyces sp. NBC_00637 TaxID=2903667 RepID=UPI002F91B1EA